MFSQPAATNEAEAPKGAELLSPPRKGVGAQRKQFEPRRGGTQKAKLSKNIFRIEFEMMFFQKRYIFLLISPFAMMLFLIANVVNYGICIRFAHAEGAVAILPGKSTAVLAHPP